MTPRSEARAPAAPAGPAGGAGESVGGAARLALAALLLLLAGAAACVRVGPGAAGDGDAAAAGASADSACAVILSTNDSHGRMHPETPAWADGREVGGVAALGGYFGREREEARPCPLFLLSGGDVMQGTPISNLVDGESMIAAFNALGFDAAAIGNHEFDWGVPVLRERMGQADFPFLSANVFVAGTDRHPEWVRPYAILERDGVRIGVIGGSTESTPITTKPAMVEGLDFRPLGGALERYIPEVRARGVDFVVILIHAGAFCEAGVCEGEAVDELEAIGAPFDYAVTGHTHSRVETRIGGAPVIQSFANTTAYGVGRLDRRPDGRVEGRILGIRTAWVDSVAPDPALAALVERYEARVAARAGEPVATLAEPLPDRGRLREHALGRLIADAQRAATGTDVAIMNNGGIRQGLPAGPVTYGDLFKVQPFANALVAYRLPGSTLLSALEHGLEEDGPHTHLSGIVVRYDPEAARGDRILSAVLTDGRRVHPDSAYSVTVNDFMATGGSGFTMFPPPPEGRQTGIVDLEALVDHLRSLPEPVRAPPEPRWIPVETAASAEDAAATP